MFWHPDEQKLKIYQFGGNGTVGMGSIEHKGGHKTEALQTFYNPGGTSSMVGHREDVVDGATHTQSFDVSEDGVWTPRRSYIWHREVRSGLIHDDRRLSVGLAYLRAIIPR